MEQLHASRRPARDLVPAMLAAGAGGLGVSLVVGGTTAGIERVVPPAAPVAELAAAPTGDAGISVHVRPSLPRPIPVTAAVEPPSLSSLLAAAPARASVLASRVVAVPPPVVVAQAVAAPVLVSAPVPEVAAAAAHGRQARVAAVLQAPPAAAAKSERMATADAKAERRAAKAERKAAKPKHR